MSTANTLKQLKNKLEDYTYLFLFPIKVKLIRSYIF